MKDNLIKIPLHSIKLPKTGKNDDFVDKFNTVSDLYEKVWEEGITEEEQRKRWDSYASYKYCLEQGII